MTIIPATTNAMTYCYFFDKEEWLHPDPHAILYNMAYSNISLYFQDEKKSHANNIKDNHICIFLYSLNSFNLDEQVINTNKHCIKLLRYILSRITRLAKQYHINRTNSMANTYQVYLMVQFYLPWVWSLGCFNS